MQDISRPQWSSWNICNHFGESGDIDELYEKFSMSEKHIAEAAKRVIQKRRNTHE